MNNLLVYFSILSMVLTIFNSYIDMTIKFLIFNFLRLKIKSRLIPIIFKEMQILDTSRRGIDWHDTFNKSYLYEVQ